VNIFFDYRRIDPHLAPFHNLLFLRHGHHPLVEVLDDLRFESQSPLIHDRVVRNFTAAHSREGALDQVGPHLALHHLIAPVADVLEQEQAQHDFSGRAPPALGSALGAALGQGFVHAGKQLLIVEQLVGGPDPVVPQVADFLGDERSAKLAWARRASITGHLVGCAGGGIGTQENVIQLAQGLDGFFQLLVVAQPLAHLRNLFAIDAELAGATTGIADGEHGLGMSFAAGALGAVAAVAGDALEQGAAQQLAGDGEVGEKSVACLQSLFMYHLYR
jgi:hypothetical protein